MTIAFAIQNWRPYLLGRQFVVHIDKSSLKYLLEQRSTKSGSQNFWVIPSKIQYCLGLENRVVDALSQYPELTALTLSPIVNFKEIQKEVETDEALNHIRMEW